MKRRHFLQGLGASAALLAMPRWGQAAKVDFKLHNKDGQKVLLNSLNDPDFWNGIEVERPTDQLYDEFKIKKLDAGYLTFVSGEGGEDFGLEHVAQTVFNFQHKLPKHMAGAKAMKYFGKGTDASFGVPYTDMVFIGDMDFFYCEYFQRMYRYDLPSGVTICAFEGMSKALSGEKRWEKYKETKKNVLEKADLRWPIFNDVIPVTEVFGMYIVSPGTTLKTRVTLTAKLRFGTGTGFLAEWGSEIPYLVRSGTLNGFNASVGVASYLKSGKYKMP